MSLPAESATIVPPRTLRVLLMLVMLAGWFSSQALIGSRGFPSGGVGDAVHAWTAPLHDALLAHPGGADALLIVSSFFIDVFGVCLLVAGVAGSSVRPLVGLFMLFGLRQICQLTCALPPPDAMIWRNPGVPSLFVTYGVSNDLFFSGHTAIAVFGATELARSSRPWLKWVAASVALFEAATVLVLRAHYTIDVFTGAVTALFIAGVAVRVATPIDRGLSRMARRSTLRAQEGR